MIDFVPADIYESVFNIFVLTLIAYAACQGFTDSVFKPRTQFFNSAFGFAAVAMLIIYIGWRPVNPYYFGDTINYAIAFSQVQASAGTAKLFGNGEWLFNSAMKWFAGHGDIHDFLLFCAAVYAGTLWIALVRIFGRNYFIPLVVCISMFTFWSYGVNGIRNGMASSIVILAMTYRRNLPVAIALAAAALGIHRSMMLTVGAAALAAVVSRPKLFLYGWLGSIVLSLAAGGKVSNLIAASGVVGDDRFTGYLTHQEVIDEFSRTGFRWDFLLYSAMPVLVGSYFIFKRKYADRFYVWIFNTYLITNAFWIIVIRAAFSNRFAQISWFIMPLVLIYPFVMKRFWDNQSAVIGWSVPLFYLFTFYSIYIAQ